MAFATLLSQLIVNILVIIFLVLLIALVFACIKAVNEWKKLAQKIATLSFWINMFTKAPLEIFKNNKDKKKTTKEC